MGRWRSASTPRARIGAERLIAQQTKKLRNGAADAVIRLLGDELGRIPKTGPGNKGSANGSATSSPISSRTGIGCATRRTCAQPTSTSAAAATREPARNLVGIRFDGPGMRWSRERLSGSTSAAFSSTRCAPNSLPTSPVVATSSSGRSQFPLKRMTRKQRA